MLMLLAAAGTAAAQWESSPYDVLVLVAAEAEPPALEAARRIAERLPILLPGVGNQAWTTTVRLEPSPALLPLAAGRSAVPEEALALLGEKERPEKVMLVAAHTTDGEVVFVQEIDARLRLAGPVVRCERRQRAGWEEAAVEGIVAAFRPLVRLERGTATEIAVVPRAARLLDEGSPLSLPPGAVLQPFVRRNDRYGEAQAKDIQLVAWTYLIAPATPLAPGQRRVTCDVVSGMGNPLGGRVSTRIERLAIVLRPEERGTILTFRTRLGAKEPLAGLEVLEIPLPAKPTPATETPATPAAAAPTVKPVPLGVSDHRGEIHLPPISGTPLQMLLVRHGREALARLPVVPGASERITAYLPDDRPRLDAEGYLLGMQQQVIDAAARREILAARCRRLVEDGKLAGIEPLLVEMRALPTRDGLKQQLAVQQAKFPAADPAIKKKIDKMFADVAAAIDKHLDPTLIEKISQSLPRMR